MIIFGKQKTTTTYAPQVSFVPKDRGLFVRYYDEKTRQSITTAIGSNIICLNVASLSVGWRAFATGKGKVVQNLTTVTKPYSDMAFPAQPTVSPGTTSRGKPSTWQTFARVDVLIAGIPDLKGVRCELDFDDEIMQTIIFGFCEAATSQKLKLQLVDCEDDEDNDGTKIVVPNFTVIE